MKGLRKVKYIKVVLAGMFTYLILFTCACLYITYKTGSEPETLIMSVFAFCGIEGGLSAWIKVTKEKKVEGYENKASNNHDKKKTE